jgi:hypothetical protein
MFLNFKVYKFDKFRPFWVIIRECTSIYVQNVDYEWLKLVKILLEPFVAFKVVL